jgi:hypothetical protein
MPVVEVAEETGSILLRLPPRDLRRFAVLGGGCILAAVLFGGLIFMLNVGFGGQQQVEPSDFLISIIVASIGLLFVGFSLIGSRTEVRIEDGRIRITEILGPIRWSFGCPIDKVRRLAVRHMLITARTETAPPPKPDDRAVLVIECRGHPEVPFGHGYRRKQLLELAAEIVARCGKMNEADRDAFHPFEIVEQDEATLFEEREIQPNESAVSCDQHPDGVTLIVPPDSLWKITGQAMLAAIPVLILLTIRIVNIILFLPNVFLFDVIAVGFGCFMLTLIWLHARARGRRQSVFAVVGDKLMVIEAGVFRSKKFEWDRAELYDVRSGTPLNGVKGHTFELQVWKRDGKKESLLRGRADGELRWMATMIRRALRLPAKSDEIAEKQEAASAV